MKSLFGKLAGALVLVGVLVLAGCGGSSSSGGSGNPTLQSIAVAPANPSVFIGAGLQFTATGTYSSGPTKDLTASVAWTSSNTATAIIAAGGLSTALATGTTTITATMAGVSGNTTLTVPGPTSITVTPATVSIAHLTVTNFTATGTYGDGTIRNLTSAVTWSSSNTAVATISNGTSTQGTASALTAGMTTITATLGAVSGTAMLTVTNANLVSIAVTPAAAAIPLGVQRQYTATGTFSDATTQDITNIVTWASSSPNIASITVSGLATGLKLGSSTISATFNAITGSTGVTVNAANLASLAVTPANPSIAASTSQQFIAIGTFNDGSTKNVTGSATWTSSATGVATIGVANGVAKGLTPGSTMISATLGAIMTTVPLTVTNATVASISVTPTGRSIAPGTKLTFTATASFSDGTTQVVTPDVTWASSNTAIATINSAGISTGVSAGTANITASLGGQMGTASLTVTGATLSSIAVTPASALLAPASTLIYQAVGTYNDGTTQNISNVVTWSSSNTSVVSISASGTATGQSAGSATIQAAVGAISGTSNVIVEASALQSITITPGTTTIPAQVGVQYTATAHFADGMTQDITTSVTWTSSTPSVATISNSTGITGLAVGVAPGSTTITAAFGGVVGTAQLSVNSAALSSITVTPATATITVGNTQQFNASGNFNDGTSFNLNSQVTWSSSNVNFAVISGSGLANGVAAGSTTIKAALGSTNGTATLTVQ